VVEPLEGLVGILHFEVVAQAALWRKEEKGDAAQQSPERAGNSRQSSERRCEQGFSLQSWDRVYCTRAENTGL
jgi:hypothetical protein